MLNLHNDKTLNQSYSMQEDLGKIPLRIMIYHNITSDSSYEIESRYYEPI